MSNEPAKVNPPPDPRWKAKAQKPRGRIVVVERLYHQPADGSPTSTESAFSRMLDTDEQPFIRHLQVKREFSAIPLGWFEAQVMAGLNVGMMQLKNEHKDVGDEIEVGILVEIPQEPAKERTMFSAPKIPPVVAMIALLLPGESMRLMPMSLQNYRVRTIKAEGFVRCTLTLLPR